MKLDQRGDIAIAEIVLYVPILLLSIILVARHGAARKAGWIFFAILSISAPYKLLVAEYLILIVVVSADRRWNHTCPLGTKSVRYYPPNHLQYPS